MGKNKKAELLGKADDKTCDICYLIKSQNPKVKFTLIDEGTFYVPNDSYVCEHCLAWIRDLRSKCEEQCQNPDRDVFKDITFWHDPKKEEKSAIEVKESAKLQTS